MKLFRLSVLIFIILIPAVSSALFLGPYTGKVIDSQTGEPIEGASVLIYWTKSVQQIMGSSTGLIELKLIYTNKDGRYEIPKIFANTGLLSIFESTNFIIYQPGYQAYILKIWHDSSYTKPDISFKEKDNLVKLDRIPPNFSYRKHYEDIDHALGGIRDYPYVSPQPEDHMTWKRLLEMNIETIPDKEEFLRRVEWEEKRGMLENRE